MNIESSKNDAGIVSFYYSGTNQTLHLTLVPTFVSPTNPRCIADGYLRIKVATERYTSLGYQISGKSKYDLSKIPAKLPLKIADPDIKAAYAAIVPSLI
jgi:hypothetical protein